MGKVLSVISRKSRRFNAENRAHRFLDKEKRDAAPKFKANLEDYKRVLEGEKLLLFLNETLHGTAYYYRNSKFH